MVLAIKSWAFHNSKILVRSMAALWLLNLALYLLAGIEYRGIRTINLVLFFAAASIWMMDEPRT